MNICKDIEEKLAAYLDGDITFQEKKLVEEHLNSCSRCSKSLEELKNTMLIVHGLEEIDPPPWLKHKIMAHIRGETEENMSIFRKLFFPLHIKVPAEVFAACLVALIAFQVFKTTGTEMKAAYTPSESVPITSRDYPDIPLAKDTLPARGAKDKTAPPVQKGAEESVTPGKTLSAPISPAKPLPAPLVSDYAGITGLITKEQEIEGKREIFQSAPPLAEAPPVLSKKKEAVIAYDIGAQNQAGHKTASGVSQLKASAINGKRIISIAVRTENTIAAGRKIEDMLSRFNAADITQESQEIIKTITATLPSQILKEFIEKLKTIGEVKENIPLYNITEGSIMVRIEIVNNSKNP